MKRALETGVAPFVPFDRTCGVPFYRQIYEGYREAILSGLLRPGQRLPSTRALAAEVGISRLPVLTAFEQLLHEGYLEGKVGSGTYVRESIPDELSRPVLPPPPTSVRRIRRSATPRPSPQGFEHGGGMGPFRVSLPALDQFPHKVWGRLVRRHAGNVPVDLMAYGDPAGYLPLREAIAEYLRTARAVDCDAGQVLIVSGSQMALQLCALALTSAGDAMCMEEPGYPGARDALGTSRAAVVPVAVDEGGIDVGRIERLGRPVRVAYVTPSHQYPLGMSMAASRRLELLGWAERNHSWILEDDYDSEYRYASRPLGALQGMGSSGRVIYLGTFSKVLFPSLRLGYVVVPPELVSTFVRLRETLDIFSPTLYQLVLTDFLRDGHFARHLRRMRTIYLARRNALIRGVDRHVRDVLTVGNADAGLHLVGFLADAADDRRVVRRAAGSGLFPTALSTCYATKGSRSGLILGFGGSNEQAIEEAVPTLGAVIRSVM